MVQKPLTETIATKSWLTLMWGRCELEEGPSVGYPDVL